MNEMHHEWNTSFKPVIIGFILSAILLFAAYFIVTESLFKGWKLLLTVIGLGTIQSFIQIVLFLHVGVEGHPRWNLLVFLFLALMVVILVGGSLWIMYNLDYNMMLM